MEALLRRGAYGTLADEDEANEAAKYVCLGFVGALYVLLFIIRTHLQAVL